MMELQTNKPKRERAQWADANVRQDGRCIYCDARCNHDAQYHEYCHQEYLLELRRLEGLSRLKRERGQEED